MLRKIIKTLAASTLLLSGVALAETDADKGFYLGLIAGQDRVDVSGFDNGTAGGLMAGYRFPNGAAIELVSTSSDIEADDLMADCLVELDTVALYGAWRSSGQAYFKGRAGLLSEKLTPRDSCSFLDSESESGLSFGLGGGMRFGKIALEAEYTLVESDVDRLSLSILYNF